jgi:hypothetical protein
MKSKALLSFVFSSILSMPQLVSAADSLTPGNPVELSRTQGKFDFIKIDSANSRLLACHTGNASLDVIDVTRSNFIKSIPTGNAQGVAIDSKNNRYFVSVSKPPKMVIVDSTKLEVIGEVALPGPADLIAYHSETNRVFICRDDKPAMWVIDPVEKKILSTINFPGGGMEDLGFDSPFVVIRIKALLLRNVNSSVRGLCSLPERLSNDCDRGARRRRNVPILRAVGRRDELSIEFKDELRVRVPEIQR